MPVTSSDIQRRLTTKSGAAGDTLTSTPGGSLGKYVSTTLLVNASLHNLFDLVTGEENLLMEDEFRCLALLNNHGSSSMQNTRAFLVSQGAGGVNFEIGADTNSSTPKGQSAAQFVEIADEDTAPAGVAFSAPTTYATGVTLGGGTIAAGSVAGLWIRRIAQNSASLAGDTVKLRVQWDSV